MLYSVCYPHTAPAPCTTHTCILSLSLISRPPLTLFPYLFCHCSHVNAGLKFLGAAVFAVTPHNSIPRAIGSFFLFHSAGHLALAVLLYYQGAVFGGNKGAGVTQSAKASAQGSVTPGTTRGSGTATGETMVTETGGTVGGAETTVGDETEESGPKGGSPRVVPLKR